MKSLSSPIALVVLAIVPLLANCSSTGRKASAEPLAPAPAGKDAAQSGSNKTSAPAAKSDDVDEYAAAEISDPLQDLNRATFRFNDGLYTFLFRPISKGYEAVFPSLVRQGIDNAYDNVKFPVRFVNCLLQVRFERAGKETEKFVVNTTVGVGGLVRMSDRISSLLDVPPTDTGLTFADWGMGHGPYIVIPFLGPSSLRDGVGLIGDYALHPVNWGVFWHGRHDWTMIPPSVNTLRALPGQLGKYDAATSEAVDPYISVRSAYMQYRAEAARK